MKLALGTVQFGMDYGVSNVKGQVLLDEAKSIVECAQKAKINTLDTAYLYGSSEAVLGEILTGFTANVFKIITKLPAVKDEKITRATIAELGQNFNQSLVRLKKDNVYGLLLHSSKDFFLNGGRALKDFLFALKEQGKVEKIGISVYSPDELEQALEFLDSTIDIVQLPLNIFDQRFLHTGWLTKLRDQNIEVHTRSLFLQGLLLLPIEKCKATFHAVTTHLQLYDRFLKHFNLSALECNLGFIKSISSITKVLIGVTSVKELDEIIKIYHEHQATVSYSELSSTDLTLIDPRMWK